jgi:hypothetical protein
VIPAEHFGTGSPGPGGVQGNSLSGSKRDVFGIFAPNLTHQT